MAFAEIRRALADEGISIVRYNKIPEHHARLRERFLEEIFPVLTPLSVDPGHPFPYISTLSLSIAVGLRDPETGERRFARVKVPPVLPRLIEVEPHTWVLIDQVIANNLDALFSGMEITDAHLFRVTRNADLAIEEDEADDLLLAIEEELRRRRFGEAVRLEVERSMPDSTRRILLEGIGLGEDDCYEVSGMLDLTGLWDVVGLDRPDLQIPTWTPVVPSRLIPPDEDEPADVFAAIRTGRHPGPPPVRLVRRLRRAVHRPGRRGPRRPDHQADPLSHLGRLAHRPRSSSGRPSGASRSSSWSRSRPVSTRRRTSTGRASWSRPAPTSSTGWSA